MGTNEPDQPLLQSWNRQLQTYLTCEKTDKLQLTCRAGTQVFSPCFSLPVGEVL